MRDGNGKFYRRHVHENTGYGPQKECKKYNNVELNTTKGCVCIRVFDTKQMNTG